MVLATIHSVLALMRFVLAMRYVLYVRVLTAGCGPAGGSLPYCICTPTIPCYTYTPQPYPTRSTSLKPIIMHLNPLNPTSSNPHPLVLLRLNPHQHHTIESTRPTPPYPLNPTLPPEPHPIP